MLHLPCQSLSSRSERLNGLTRFSVVLQALGLALKDVFRYASCSKGPIMPHIRCSGVTSLLRSAWSDVRKDTSRIAQEHLSTADSLQVLYDNLLAFRVSKEKLAKRCKEQLRTATTEHTDYKLVSSPHLWRGSCLCEPIELLSLACRRIIIALATLLNPFNRTTHRYPMTGTLRTVLALKSLRHLYGHAILLQEQPLPIFETHYFPFLLVVPKLE